jgi:hypothetical protein
MKRVGGGVVAGVKWLIVDCGFRAYSFTAVDGSGKLGVQILTAFKLGDSGLEIIRARAPEREPGAFTAAELAAFIDQAIAAAGQPETGVVLMAPVWLGLVELAANPATAGQVALPATAGECWPRIAESQLAGLRRRLDAAGLELQCWEAGRTAAWN